MAVVLSGRVVWFGFQWRDWLDVVLWPTGLWVTVRIWLDVAPVAQGGLGFSGWLGVFGCCGPIVVAGIVGILRVWLLMVK